MRPLLLSSALVGLILTIVALFAIQTASQAGSGQTPPKFKVAFIGDQGISSGAGAVLQLVKNEGADMVLHQGDLGYGDENSEQTAIDWDAQVTSILGDDFPYFASVGNHDVGNWATYQSLLIARLGRVSGASCTGDYGVMAACTYQGLFFILSGTGTSPNTPGHGPHIDYIREQLAQDDSIWRICTWHKNQNAMQVGSKANEVGWESYEECRRGRAIIATGHEHSYSRTRTMSNTQTQTVDSNWPNPDILRVSAGSTFSFVSGLGGSTIRDQDRCLPTTQPYGCNGEWATIYTSDQGAEYGALFIEFNVDGDPTKATGYFKTINGEIVDSFTVFSEHKKIGETPTPTEIAAGLWVFDAFPGGPGYTSPYAAGPNPLYYWATLEPQEGVYNWAPLDRALADAANSGKLVSPRIYTNVAGWGQATATWVFDAGTSWYYNNAFSRDNAMKQPVPTDPVFTEKFGAFLSALGARYDGNPRIEFFQTNAGMGEYGEMVWGWPDEFKPPGWTPEQNLVTVRFWIERWLEAFPSTRLAFMINTIGWNIETDASAYAVDRGFYLQQNSARADSETMDIFRAMQDRTRIGLELESAARTGDGFDALMDDIFSRGFAIYYLILHRTSFIDPATAAGLTAVQDRLRGGDVNPPPSTVPKDPDGDTDGDTVPNVADADDDNDGCSDAAELAPKSEAGQGGGRDPHNFWDFFDPNRDRSVGHLDFLALLRHYDTTGDPSGFDPDAAEPPTGEYWAAVDRGGTTVEGGDPWDELPPDGEVNFSDFLSLLRQFTHSCKAPP